MNLFKTVGGIFLVVGLAMLAASSYLYVDQRDFIAGAKTSVPVHRAIQRGRKSIFSMRRKIRPMRLSTTSGDAGPSL